MSEQGRRPTILVTGKTGQLGYELRRTLSPLGRVIAPGRPELDLAGESNIRGFAREHKPSLIVNAAAYTDVDKAETEPETARALNAVAPGILAEEAARLGAAIVHFSTDYVFDGTKTKPYAEDDEPNPLSVYGETKLAGEEAVRASGAMFVILRLSWVYSMRRRNFLRSVLDQAEKKGEIKVVDDQIGAPCWARMAAEASVEIAGRLLSGLDWFDGIYHLPAGGRTSRFGFAEEIFRLAKGRPGIGEAKLEPAPTSAMPALAKRPAFSVLSGKKLEESFGLKLPDWKEQLAMALDAG